MAIPFDTLKYSHHLEQSGLPRNQAEAIAELQRDALASIDHQVATKVDIDNLKASLAKDEFSPIKIDISSLKLYNLGIIAALAFMLTWMGWISIKVIAVSEMLVKHDQILTQLAGKLL